MTIAKFTMARKVMKKLLIVLCIFILILWVGFNICEKLFWLESDSYYNFEVLKPKYNRDIGNHLHAYNTFVTTPRSEKSYKQISVVNRICSTNWNDNRDYITRRPDVTIYFVTPSYPRPEQIPELTRLSHTLMHVPGLHWIVADDTPHCSDIVADILKRAGLPFTHISSPKPFIYHQDYHNPPRGVANRLAAIDWIRSNVKHGVLYFGDDDNTVDLQLFDEIRNTKKVSMFPVGLIGTFGVSSPVIVDGKVVAFFDGWTGNRNFAVDMAGFAVNLDLIGPSTDMPYEAGQLENKFLHSLGVNLSDIEPLADNCTRVLVWHTKTVRNRQYTLKVDEKVLNNQKSAKNLLRLLKAVTALNMVKIDATQGITPYVSRHGKTFNAFNFYSGVSG